MPPKPPPDPAGAGPNLLTAPLFHVTGNAGGEALSLPALLARLLTGPEIHGFPNLAAEQRGYFWRFLVRCAAKALRELALDVDAAASRRDLADALSRALADAAPAGAWEMYQPDPALPGFLQPPAPDGPPQTGGYAANPPSLLTGALGAKDHERKYDVVRQGDAEQMAYALIEYQTAAIYGGRGNYGSQISGSASGAGSGTPFMGARIGGSEGESFRHDVATVLRRWEQTRAEHGLRGRVWALWAQPWDGKGSLPSTELDPAFIPVARMVRLGALEDGIFRTVWFRPSDRARVDDLSGGGNLGDPFTPLVTDAKDPTVFKVRGTLGKGYDYAEVVGLLFGKLGERGARPSPSVQALRDADDGTRHDLAVLFEGVAYEQGKTGGFHRRLVLLPPGTVDVLAEPDSDLALHVRATNAEMLERVKDARGAVRGAARIYLTGSPGGRDADARADRATDGVEPRVDAIYLDRLVANAKRRVGGDETWQWTWGAELREIARDVFEAALPALPVSTVRRFERETGARSYLEHRLAQLADPASVLGTGAPSQPREVTA